MKIHEMCDDRFFWVKKDSATLLILLRFVKDAIEAEHIATCVENISRHAGVVAASISLYLYFSSSIRR
jgi:uncharacterized protein (DUF1697 family)